MPLTAEEQAKQDADVKVKADADAKRQTQLDAEAATVKAEADKAKLDAAKLKAESKEDELPDEYKGKSITDIIKLAEGLKKSSSDGDSKSKAEITALTKKVGEYEAYVRSITKTSDKKELTKEEIETAFYADPIKFIQQTIHEAVSKGVKPLADNTISDKAAAERAKAAAKYEKKGWSELSKEVDERMASIPAEIRASKDSYIAMFRQVKAEHDEAAEDTNAINDDDSISTGGRTKSATKKYTLTPEQRHIASRLGITEAEYAKQQELIGV